MSNTIEPSGTPQTRDRLDTHANPREAKTRLRESVIDALKNVINNPSIIRWCQEPRSDVVIVHSTDKENTYKLYTAWSSIYARLELYIGQQSNRYNSGRYILDAEGNFVPDHISNTDLPNLANNSVFMTMVDTGLLSVDKINNVIKTIEKSLTHTEALDGTSGQQYQENYKKIQEININLNLSEMSISGLSQPMSIADLRNSSKLDSIIKHIVANQNILAEAQELLQKFRHQELYNSPDVDMPLETQNSVINPVLEIKDIETKVARIEPALNTLKEKIAKEIFSYLFMYLEEDVWLDDETNTLSSPEQIINHLRSLSLPEEIVNYRHNTIRMWQGAFNIFENNPEYDTDMIMGRLSTTLDTVIARKNIFLSDQDSFDPYLNTLYRFNMLYTNIKFSHDSDITMGELYRIVKKIYDSEGAIENLILLLKKIPERFDLRDKIRFLYLARQARRDAMKGQTLSVLSKETPAKERPVLEETTPMPIIIEQPAKQRRSFAEKVRGFFRRF